MHRRLSVSSGQQGAIKTFGFYLVHRRSKHQVELRAENRCTRTDMHTSSNPALRRVSKLDLFPTFKEVEEI